MNTEKQTYIKSLINEEILKLIPEGFSFGRKAPGSAGPAVSDDDDDEIDASDIFGIADDGNEMPDFSDAAGGVGMGKSGDAFQKAKTPLDQQLDRIRKGQPFADPNDPKNGKKSPIYQYFIDPTVKNKHNKYKRDSKNPNMNGIIQVSFAHSEPTDRYNFPYSIITLLNINPWDVQELWKKFSGVGHTERVNVAARRVNFGKDGATFIVADENLDLWKEQDLPKIIEFLGSCTNDDGTPRYGGPETMETLDATIKNRIYKQEDVENYWYNAEKTNLDKYKSYLESEDDEEVNAIIELYARAGLMDYVCKKLNLPESFGHILSWKNAKAIISSGRNATFVLPEEVWNRVFGRVVVPNAQPFFVRIPNVKNKKGKWKNPTAFDYSYIDNDGKFQKVRLTSTEDILQVFYNGTPYDKLSKQQQFFVNCLANINNTSSYFGLQEYDVSDTKWDPSISPKDENGNPIDVFNDTVGLTTNLRRGGLNQAAQDELARRASELDNEPVVDTNDVEDAPENTDARLAQILNRTRAAYKNVEEYVKGNGMSFKETPGDVSLSLVNALLMIAKKMFPSTQGITNPRLFTELAENAVYFVCRLEYIALDRINSFRHIMKVTDDDVAKFSNLVDLLVNIVEGVGAPKQGQIALEESNEPSQLKNLSSNLEFVNKKAKQFLMKINNEAEREGLYEMIQRMDASKKNLL